MAKKPSWALIIAGIVVLIVVVCVGVLAVAGYFVYRQFAFESAPATQVSVEREFTRIHDRFKGQKPLLEMQDGEPVVAEPDTEPPAETKPSTRHNIEAVHILVWQPEEGKVFRMNIPFWIVRMSKGKPFHLSRTMSEDGEPLRLKVTAADIERRGPGLILDLVRPGRERVLVWAE